MALRYRTKGLGLGDQYTAEIMPDSMSWPKDGEMEEEFQRGVDARKQGKVSFLEVEEEKTREVVDEMKPGAQISLFRIKGRASEGVITHQNLALVQYHPKRGIEPKEQEMEVRRTKAEVQIPNLGGDVSS